VRLGIVSALAVNQSLSFNELKDMLSLTDGNLSVHARKLERRGTWSAPRASRGRVPRTEFRLAETGRRALAAYLDHMEALIQAVRDG
jgi:DNA-binding MarR family transcriptional regulator